MDNNYTFKGLGPKETGFVARLPSDRLTYLWRESFMYREELILEVVATLSR